MCFSWLRYLSNGLIVKSLVFISITVDAKFIFTYTPGH